MQVTNSIYKQTRPQESSLSDEGVMRLVSAILSATYHDYVRSLKTIMSFNKKTSRKTKTDYRNYDNALKTKLECEIFYKSKLFITYTLGKSKPGEEVIKDIQNKIGFVEEIC